MDGPDSTLYRLLRQAFCTRSDGELTEAERSHLQVHLTERTAKARRIYQPWLSTLLVPGERSLEIGVGTGCASPILIELGQRLDGVEPTPEHRAIAVERLRLAGSSYGHLFQGFFPAILPEVPVEEYASVFLWASLEHMTLPERLAGLRSLWQRMRPGSRLFILECPNRIWFSDAHTGGLEFYHWVPDDFLLAQGVNSCQDRESLYRLGRAAGFHELRAAGIPVGPQSRIDSLQLWGRRANILKRAKWLLNGDGRYERRMHRTAPRIHRALFHEHLDVVIRK